MEQLRERLWRRYQRDQYTLIAIDWTHRGATLDLVCEKMGAVAFVFIRDTPPGPAEQAVLNRALCTFLRSRRASGVYVRWDRAWLEEGRLRTEEGAFPVEDPDLGLVGDLPLEGGPPTVGGGAARR